jgi:hypothetical protein
MVSRTRQPNVNKISINVTLEKADFKGTLKAYVFDSAGRLLDETSIKSGKIILSMSPQTLLRSRLFIAPADETIQDTKPTLKSLSRLGAYSPPLRAGGSLIERIQIPASLIEAWFLCVCLVKGRVIKHDTGHPVCGAKIHICEVDKLWRWIWELPELEVFRLRDQLLKEFEVPELRRPPRPQPDPLPIDHINFMLHADNIAALGPQPEPPDLPVVASRLEPISYEMKSNLMSASAQIIRDTLIKHIDFIRPYLCLWPYWWTFRCDEVTVVESDSTGHFEASIAYLCQGDKPDLYFWVEYEIDGTLETVYHPPIPCYTYWNYTCNSEITIEVNDARVPSCDVEPDPTGCKVQIVSIGRKVSMSELQGDGASLPDEGLTTAGEPFGGKIEPRVWFSRTDLIAKGIEYYRWSYRRLTKGDGTPLTTPGPWTPMTRTVVRHYAKSSGGTVTHEPYMLGPFAIGTESNLYKIKPLSLPTGGIEWTVMDEREDLASAHFETYKLGSGMNSCISAFNGAGKYELKLELFKSSGALVSDWDAAGIALEMTDISAPFGTNTVTTTLAPTYNRINPVGGTDAFRMVLRVDNNCCSAAIDPLSGTKLVPNGCGFFDITPASTVDLGFTAGHPNNFATFSFSVKQGVVTSVDMASATGRTGTSPIVTNDSPPSHAYNLSGAGHYREHFTANELLDGCPRAAFSEALHVWTMAQDGYGRIWSLDRFTHAGFALALP